MKDYNPGRYGLTFIFSLEGSVFPRAFCIAFPNACVAAGIWYIWRKSFAKGILDPGEESSQIDIGQIWSLFNFIITFAVSFRAQRAYSRWWEGGTLLQQARGEWFNGYSSLIAFCTRDAAKIDLVRRFQHSLSRLVSMLHASALMSVSTDIGIDFEVIDAAGISETHLDFLRGQSDKCEIIMQWIQRLIVDNMENGCLPIPPPVISRVFQELSRGIVNIHNVRKITEFQFPFPLAQMINVMLICQWFSSPLVCSILLESPIWAAFLTFVPTFSAWGINMIAAEIEQPFGTDANDMPMHFMQASMNKSILSLLELQAQEPPPFDLKEKACQIIWTQPSKNGGTPGEMPATRSIAFLTVRDVDDILGVSRRFSGPRYAHKAPAFAATVARLSKRSSMSELDTMRPDSVTLRHSSTQSSGRDSAGIASSPTVARGNMLHATWSESSSDPKAVRVATRLIPGSSAGSETSHGRHNAWEPQKLVSKAFEQMGSQPSPCPSPPNIVSEVSNRSLDRVGLNEVPPPPSDPHSLVVP